MKEKLKNRLWVLTAEGHGKKPYADRVWRGLTGQTFEVLKLVWVVSRKGKVSGP